MKKTQIPKTPKQNNGPRQDSYLLTFTHSVPLDERGIIDGRTLTASLMDDAFHVLAPYVDNFPDCAALFLSLVLHVIEEIGRSESLTGRIGAPKSKSPEEADRLFEQHRAANQAVTAALVAEGHYVHELIQTGAALRRAVGEGTVQ